MRSLSEAILPLVPLAIIAELLREDDLVRLHTDIHGHLPSLPT